MADANHLPGQSYIGSTLRQAHTGAGQVLRQAGVDDAMLDAGLLLAHAVQGDRLTLIKDPQRILSDVEALTFDQLITARAGRQPVSRLLGRREFWSLDLAVDAAVLDPRPDSETIVAAALAHLPDVDAAYQIIDFGTGSGCLLLALLMERPGAWGLGLDLSPPAAALARSNARRLGLSRRAQFVVGDWGQSLSGQFDLIVSNPPYIPSADIPQLEPEVRCHDPALALDGGGDGLAAYQALVPELGRLLKPEGHVVLECGQGQISALEVIVEAAGLRVVDRHMDMAGIDRCLVASQK
ncbi:MAG: peptide chain release factor N(5)-glutamine methyltransferase [Rhodospirillaceae bacterium]|jgi:release factor glutamine methyltransferase|nr:peptide chain release factor N(5)-glutamine methyltransferase [Rhodospirillaceae bacterium]MBT4687311.1 peptide chain release factor N(5)-glutamine methyltransferase [Rhodospirillaceae bacterium]MBT5083916.1 peptide chain release factor N(5)-glutamine methyltransferase [Rhodospirillaceae bacterium]MBT5526676.1 peptide chain release factor N(5)-glutamine methyltransferase [Rhodospirillaceae bacterium]MBT5882326.1 peptide chain release factor N(5)-glutamine methyltransferase [Rhodospirillaceae